MDIRKWINGFSALILLVQFSCIDEKDLSKSASLENYDLSFDYQMRSERLLTVKAMHPDGSIAADVPFSVYLENPYGEEGNRLEEVQPVCGAVTDEDGVRIFSVDVPNQVKVLYVATPYVGYGGMQTCEVNDYMNLVFQSTNMPMTRNFTRAYVKTDEITRPGKLYNSNTNVYAYYRNDFFDTGTKLFKDGKSVDPELISSENVTDISASARYMFPEKKTVDDEKYFTADYNTDLVVTEPILSEGETYGGTRVWATFLGDGGFSIGNISIINSLCYYTYPTNNPPTDQDVQTLRKTLIYPNTNEKRFGQYLVGSKIQLMYWDEERQLYTSHFPAGVSIGWALVSGNNKDTNTTTEKIGDLSAFRFSTPVLNNGLDHPYRGAFTNGIARWSEEGNCSIVGMENRLHSDENKFNDMDYNDILFKVEADPVIKPKDVIPVPEERYEYGISGTLAFEDSWPKKGDYDFNDFVTDYTYTMVKDSEKSNVLKEIQLTFTPKAVGALYISGFSIQLPVSSGMIEKVEGALLESGEEPANLIVCNNTHSLFGMENGFINTKKEGNKYAADPCTVRIFLKKNMVRDDVSPSLISQFNPFIFVQERSKEIHLVDMAPTNKADRSLFGTYDDASDDTGYYRLKLGLYPWALDIPCVTKTGTWHYPRESEVITNAYPNYKNWTNIDGHGNDWLRDPQEEFLY